MRVVALGASNLTRGFPALVSTARARWGPEVEVLAALGLGRSYGAPSRILVRTLPGILQSGLWAALDDLPPEPTRGLVTDVGNDILYGFAPSEITAWVEESVVRLLRHTRDIVLTDLPLASIRRPSAFKFIAFRTILVPQCRLSRAEIVERAEEVTAGLAALATRRGIRFLRLRPEWYGFDPVHIRPGQWRTAWREILCGDGTPDAGDRIGLLDTLRLHTLAPERQWLLGIARVARQVGRRLPSGGRIRLY